MKIVKMVVNLYGNMKGQEYIKKNEEQTNKTYTTYLWQSIKKLYL